MKALLLLMCVMPAVASDFISFAPSPSTSVTNYTLSYGPTNRSTTNRIQLGTNTTYSVSNLGPATVSFAFVSAWANGLESLPSNEILYTNRNFAPQNLRLSGTDALLLESSPDLRTWKTLAILTNGAAPLMLVKQTRDVFRVLSTNLPPLPR